MSPLPKPGPSRLHVTLVVGLLCVGSAQPASAFELFGRCRVGTCQTAEANQRLIDGKRYSVKFRVVQQDGADDGVIREVSELWRGRDSEVAGSAGLIARAKGDYRRLLAALYNQGRYAGTVSIKVDGVEAAELKPGTALADRPSVTITVGPGRPYLFGQAEIINRPPPNLLRDPDEPTSSEEAFATGMPAKADVVRRAATRVTEEWRHLGHPKAKLAEQRATANHPQRALNVLLRIEPGPFASFGPVSVQGTNHMDAGFVRYMTGLKEGEAYSPEALRRAEARLDRLGVFGARKLEEADAVTSNGLLPLTVVVNERKSRRIGLGATLSSADGAGIEAYWLHRNLFGRAERLRLDAKFGGVDTGFDTQRFDYSLGATFVQPGVFSPDTDLAWKLLANRESNETFEETSLEGSATVTHYFSDAFVGSLGSFSKYGDYNDDLGQRTFLTTGLVGSVSYDRRNSKVDPTRGYLVSASAVPFYEWEEGNPALQLGVQASAYLSLDDGGRSVLAGRIKTGFLVGPDRAQIPPDLLFTAGGGNSVRGYGFKSIGLVDTNGDVTGGKSLLEGSVEFRQRVTDAFGLVAFIDGGTVGENTFIDGSADFRVGAGLGLRYYTALGPIRLDVGLPLNPGPDDPDFAIYAGIGQAF